MLVDLINVEDNRDKILVLSIKIYLLRFNDLSIKSIHKKIVQFFC